MEIYERIAKNLYQHELPTEITTMLFCAVWDYLLCVLILEFIFRSGQLINLNCVSFLVTK